MVINWNYSILQGGMIMHASATTSNVMTIPSSNTLLCIFLDIGW